ncbi:MAG: hypothetical protein ACYC0T_07300 [Ramlibacter sp.]
MTDFLWAMEISWCWPRRTGLKVEAKTPAQKHHVAGVTRRVISKHYDVLLRDILLITMARWAPFAIVCKVPSPEMDSEVLDFVCKGVPTQTGP